jgi:hypothetical protein
MEDVQSKKGIMANMDMYEYPLHLSETEMCAWQRKHSGGPRTAYTDRRQAFLQCIVNICLGYNEQLTTIENAAGWKTNVDRFNHRLELLPRDIEPCFVHPLGSVEVMGEERWAVYYPNMLPLFVQNILRFNGLPLDDMLGQEALKWLTKLVTPLPLGHDE